MEEEEEIKQICQEKGYRLMYANQRAHFESILYLTNSAYRDKTFRGWTGEAHLIEGDRINPSNLQAIFSDPKSQLLVLEQLDTTDGVGALRGCIAVKLVEETDDRIGLAVDAVAVELGQFAVDPEFQSRGYGGALLRAAERVAKEQFKADYSQLHVLDCRQDIIAWYTRLGYEQKHDVLIPFPPISAGVGIPLVETPLFFVLLRKSIQ